MEEKRKYPRIQNSLPITLINCGWDVVTITKNISACGVYCAIDKPLEVMTKVKIKLLVPSKDRWKKNTKEIYCKGVVVRNEYIKNNGKHPYHVGIYFNEIKEKDKKSLLSYIDSHLKTAL
jgi:hypothetical protein